MNRETILKRVKALLDKTTENGCTEAEALAAMAKARILMEQHGISEVDLHATMSDIQKDTSPMESKFKVDMKNGLAVRLAEYCDVKVWKESKSLICMGAKEDRILFGYLMDYLVDFVDRSANQYAKAEIRKVIQLGLKPSHRDTMEAWASFSKGCINRINQRLKEEVDRRKADVKLSDGRSLVVVKMALVNQEFAKLGLNLNRGRSETMNVRDRNAFNAGYEAGGRASFSRQVSGDYGGTKLISG